VRVELREIIGREEAAVFGERELHAARGAGFGQDLFDEARLAVDALDDGVLEVGRLGKEQDLLRPRVAGECGPPAAQGQTEGGDPAADDHFTSAEHAKQFTPPAAMRPGARGALLAAAPWTTARGRR